MNDTQSQTYLLYAQKLADEAAKIMKQYYHTDYKKELKDDQTPVTIADTEINDMVIEKIKQDFPEHGVIGEEATWQPDAETVWVCDPIDGTTAYIVHLPTSVFSIAVVYNGVPLVAVIMNPWTNDVYTAIKGDGAFRNQQKIRVSNRQWPSVCISTSGIGPKEAGTLQDKVVASFSNEVAVTHFSGLSYQGCLIAEGAIDGRVFFHNGAHDIAAVKVIVEEAGGRVTDLDGDEQPYNEPINGAVISNGNIHNELVERVREYANSWD